ncbi:MAG: DUF4277 domain-containing protein [Kiritimatiellae bacterium]|nr:DUF4277 domain-containing protein [Kiritimatiellia bacterium]
MKIKSPPSGLEALEGAEIFNYGYLPAAAAFCRRLGVVQLVNDMVPFQMDISPGVMFQAMVLDTLAGRSPLYRIKEFMTELLCVDGGVPIFGRNLDGNSSDKKSNNAILTRMSSIMSKHGLGPGAFV